MIRLIQRTQARRILVPSLIFFVGTFLIHTIPDYYFHGRIRYDFFPHRIVLYLIGTIVVGFFRWRTESSNNENRPA